MTNLTAQGAPELPPLPAYDAGLLSDFGGGSVDWWQDYIRAELGRAHDFYESHFADRQARQAAPEAPREPMTTDVAKMVEACKRLAHDYADDSHHDRPSKYKASSLCAEAIDALGAVASQAPTLAASEPSKLRRDQIVDLISSVSNNSADHDIAFAYRVLDAASAIAPAAPAEPREKCSLCNDMGVMNSARGCPTCGKTFAAWLKEHPEALSTLPDRAGVAPAAPAEPSAGEAQS